jgi:tetratricopeptide (TPR) repeat protein
MPLGDANPTHLLALVVDHGVRPEQPDYDEAPQMSDGVWQLAESCWTKTPQSRPIASVLCDAIKHLLEDERVDKLRNAREHAGQHLSQSQHEEAKPQRQSMSGGDDETVLGEQDPTVRLSGMEERDALNSLNKYAWELFNQSKYDESEPLFRQVLEGRERVLGEDDPHSLTSLSNVGNALFFQHKYAESETFLRRALEGRERVLGKENPATLTSLNDVGNALYYQDLVKVGHCWRMAYPSPSRKSKHIASALHCMLQCIHFSMPQFSKIQYV